MKYNVSLFFREWNIVVDKLIFHLKITHQSFLHLPN